MGRTVICGGPKNEVADNRTAALRSDAMCMVRLRLVVER
jgi:hypothetical protein